MPDTILDRFLRYARVDTQSDPASRTKPSTAGQWDLLRLLAGELKESGARDVRLTTQGYVLAGVPGTSSRPDLPTVAFLAHVDTAPDFPGHGVRPIVHRAYGGGRIVLPDDPRQVLDPADPLQTGLREAVGKDLVTAGGTTLLGADDKAGIAVIMTAAECWLRGAGGDHGPLRLCFTPDEEIGRGVEHLDLDELGANAAYTLDGGAPGEIAWETFSADGAVVTIEGVSTHPGSARSRGMVNAVHLAGKLLASLPRERMSPEATEGREGFLHPTRIEGDAAKTTVHLILRDHDDRALAEKGRLLRILCAGLQASYPGVRVRCRVRRQYRNMGIWLKDDMLPVDLACEACRRAGLEPSSPATRGGTDGARLTERGLPAPNLFCGARDGHGPLEWVAVQDMEKAVEVVLELARLWAERGAGYEGYRAGVRRGARG